MKEEHFESDEKSFPKVNHFTVGFWRDKLNIHLNLRNRIISNTNKRGSKEPDKEFLDLVKNILPLLDEKSLTTEDNPLVYNRLERNIQQKRQPLRKTTAFDIYNFIYHKEFNRELLEKEIQNVAEANNIADNEDIGNERCLALGEKRIPFESELVERDDLPELCVNYLEKLYPLFEHFEK